jgi:hypothetical protein
LALGRTVLAQEMGVRSANIKPFDGPLILF